MAVRSMTGFGRSEAEIDGKIWVAELRCVNNRFLDVKIKLPHGYLALEDRVRKLLGQFFQRGRVEVLISLNGDANGATPVQVNMAVARSYWAALQQLGDELHIDNGATASLLASFPDVVVRNQQVSDPEGQWPPLAELLEKAFVNCDGMRRQEGELLVADLAARLDFFATTVAAIEQAIPQILVQRRKNLEERLDKLLGNVQLEPQRLAQEIALLADKADVTEEIVRLRCHIKQLASFLKEDLAVGRKLDFLIQEFLREVNTLASKISDATIAHLTVDLKSELEKMREQIQNIE